MIYMLAVAMMLTMLIATGFALLNEAGSRRVRVRRIQPVARPFPRRFS